MTQNNTKNAISFVLIAIALILFDIAVYTIFGWIAEFNYTEARADCNAYYKPASGQPDAIAELDRCLEDAQSTRQTTNRIGGIAGIALAVLAFGFVLWSLKELREWLQNGSKF